jgi:UPF0271 protein
MGNEEALMPYISSCSIACGGHAGDAASMRHVVRLAKRFKVAIGAHPSYPDPINFGRKSMQLPKARFIASIQEQIESLVGIIQEEKATLHHIKAHGALYNDLALDRDLSKNYLEAVQRFKNKAVLYVPYHSMIEQEAVREGFGIKREAFGDRNYNTDLSLVSRAFSNAILAAPKDVLEHILLMVHQQEVKTVQGVNVKITADTYCIHGDTPAALQILAYLSSQLPKNKIQIKGE